MANFFSKFQPHLLPECYPPSINPKLLMTPRVLLTLELLAGAWGYEQSFVSLPELSWGHPYPCLWPGTPRYPMSQCAAAPVSSSRQPSPVMTPTDPVLCPQADVPAWPQPILIPMEVPDAPGWSPPWCSSKQLPWQRVGTTAASSTHHSQPGTGSRWFTRMTSAPWHSSQGLHWTLPL